MYLLQLKKAAGFMSASSARRRAENKDAIVEPRKLLRLKGHFLNYASEDAGTKLNLVNINYVIFLVSCVTHHRYILLKYLLQHIAYICRSI